MLNLRHVLKFIVDRFYYGAFSEQHLVGDTHHNEGLVLEYSLVFAHSQWCAVNEADASALAH